MREYEEDVMLHQRDEKDFDFGYRVGFADVFLQWYQLRHYTYNFQEGYKKGKAVIEELSDIKAQSRCFC